jgi:hypothetical protein
MTMPRPTEGYRNKAGDQIPGTSDITKRFKDSMPLLFWAFKRGKDGCKKLYEGYELDIGTAVHMMAELDLQDRPEEDIEFYLTTTLRDPEHLEKARAAFKAYRQWRARFHVEAHVQEASLVSEKYQFGGTLDTVALIRNGLGLVDFKTSKEGKVYPEHLLQLAAYGLLWEENRPNEVLSAGYHLIMLPKDGSKPIHREYSRADLEPFRQQFLLLRQAFELDAICSSARALAGCEVAPSIAPERPAKPVRKPQARVEAPTQRPMSMAEIMRAYGHTKVMA